MHLGKEIGRGAHGIVYKDKNDEKKCIKKSVKNSICRVWSNEYKKIKDIYKKISHTTWYKNLKYVELLVPLAYKEYDNECFMIMPCINHPFDVESTLHPLLGEKSTNYKYKDRGVFKGLNEIQKDYNIPYGILEKISYELGLLMGMIHFIGCNDAYDIEIFLGYINEPDKLKFYIADFDLSEKITKFDKETIERMVWSLEAVQYFPTEESNANLLQKFKNGYSLTAKNKMIVEKIFENYG